jgi:hypothetical protein
VQILIILLPFLKLDKFVRELSSKRSNSRRNKSGLSSVINATSIKVLLNTKFIIIYQKNRQSPKKISSQNENKDEHVSRGILFKRSQNFH